jgi:hypothetical protein
MTRRRIAYIAVCALSIIGLLTAGSRRTSEQDTLTIAISGVVYLEATMQPIRGARIAVSSKPIQWATSDSMGHYRLSSLPRSAYTVTATRPGYITEQRAIVPQCTVAVLDPTGARVLREAVCTDPEEQLNFYLRRAAVRGRRPR